MKKLKRRKIQFLSVVAILLAAEPASADSSKQASNEFAGSGLKTFDPEMHDNKAEVDDFWVELVRIEELGSQLEDLENLDKERFDAAFQGAVEFIERAGSPEDIIAQLESRLDRMVDRLINEYSPNSGQNDELDAHMRADYDPFVNTMAEFYARMRQQVSDGTLQMNDPLSPDPRLVDDSAAQNDMAIIELLKQKIAELQEKFESVMQEAINEVDAGNTATGWALREEANKIEQEQREAEEEKRQRENAVEEAIKDNLEALQKKKDEAAKMPVPDSVDPGYPGAGIFVKLTMALEVNLKDQSSPTFGLINPGPDGDNRPIDDIPDHDRDPMGEALDPYINPGSENFDEPVDVPESLETLPQIDRFGGAVDPLGPKGSLSSDKANSGKKSEEQSSSEFGD